VTLRCHSVLFLQQKAADEILTCLLGSEMCISDSQNQHQQQQQLQPQTKISRQNAEQLLQALQNAEKNIQDKVKKQQAQQVKAVRTEKDW